MTQLPTAPAVATAELTIHRITARPVLVPLALPLVTAGGAVDKAPLVLVDLETEEGVTGSAYLFTYTPRALAATARQVEELTPLIAGQRVAPLALAERLAAAFRLLGRPGLVGMALAGLDMAAWDALAKSQGLPLYRLLGAEARRLPAYNSKGLGMIGAVMAAEEAVALLAEGFQAIKLRLGYPTRAQDLDVAAAVRKTIGPNPRLFVDFNQTLTLAEAKHRVPPLEDFDLEWIEEPLPWDDYRGHAAVAAETALPIQQGENCWGAGDFDKALEAGLDAVFMPDAMKIGGVTGWQRTAGLAAARGVQVSSHLFPEISSHLLAATPTAHWLEYVDWAAPVLAEPFAVTDGVGRPSEAPGIGIAWDETAAKRFAAEI
ncbi:enolase C-terminal domain-like protein [Algihabitans albus]|uniref:enolase C-terminal domain-like protein n=1 Tax=Algihabitans albus TaxID=2164067 RepID=UPI000E5C6F44|nr:enolase C-terminal domain-like protein [Algihabitans albus]